MRAGLSFPSNRCRHVHRRLPHVQVHIAEPRDDGTRWLSSIHFDELALSPGARCAVHGFWTEANQEWGQLFKTWEDVEQSQS